MFPEVGSIMVLPGIPEEIAISIVSELIHEKNSLRKTSGYKKELMEYLTGRKKAENGMALATIIERQGSAPREIGKNRPSSYWLPIIPVSAM